MLDASYFRMRVAAYHIYLAVFYLSRLPKEAKKALVFDCFNKHHAIPGNIFALEHPSSRTPVEAKPRFLNIDAPQYNYGGVTGHIYDAIPYLAPQARYRFTLHLGCGGQVPVTGLQSFDKRGIFGAVLLELRYTELESAHRAGVEAIACAVALNLPQQGFGVASVLRVRPG